MQIDEIWLQTEFPELTNLSPLGQGGYKLVFSALHPAEGHVVLKLIQPSQDVESIRREILAVQQVQSPRVPKILGVGTAKSQLGQCFWMRERRVLGKTVREVLQGGSLAPNHVLRLGLHVLQALAKAEEAHIVHRDVKPDNIMIDAQENFWLLDFGIARHLKLTSQTATAQFYGKFTVGYAPIEQFRNRKYDIDGRSDLFALGVTLYECAIGFNPYRQGAINELEILRRIENTRLPLLQMSFSAAAEFQNFVASLTQKRFDHRPNTVREALEWMEAICKTEGITA